MTLKQVAAMLAAVIGALAALLALAGCAPNAPASTLPLAAGQPTLLFFYTDG